VPDDVAVARVPQRLGLPMGALREYGGRSQTRTDHLREIAAYSGWRSMDASGWKDLDEFLFARAMEHGSPKLLFRLACEYLLSSRVVRPGVVNVLEHLATARTRARAAHLLDERRRAELDLLPVPDALLGGTPLAWLRVGPTSSSPAAVKDELEKLAYLRRGGAVTVNGKPDRPVAGAGIGRHRGAVSISGAVTSACSRLATSSRAMTWSIVACGMDASVEEARWTR
jgi:hypothetical protein